MKLRLRKMTPDDIPMAVRLKDAAGWNQTTLDWLRFISASPEGCFVMEYKGEVIGTSATMTYEGRFSWIGMLIVDEKYRGQGIGTTLLESAIHHLDSRQIPTIKLDATPQGKPLYQKLGFETEYEIERWMLNRAAKEKLAEKNPSSIEGVLEIDRKIFGADRSQLLHSIRHQYPHLFLTQWEKGELIGYSFGRTGSRADHLGPWVAFSKDAAERLLDLFLFHSPRELIFVDCLQQNAWAMQLVKSRGFKLSRPLTRMYRGKNKYAGQIKPLCASVGPEFG
ncbi:MAG: GNAT family N-acetyltransferase [Syntrophales bacterium]